jgi:cleavage stimulation factor subunit 3
MTARKALRELRQHTEALTPPPVIPPRPTWAEADRALAINWKKYLKWEESNPLDIEEPSALQARVIYAMRKCLTHMRFFPELWWVMSSVLGQTGANTA